MSVESKKGSASMEMGSSESAKEYNKAASTGETRSAFASITSKSYDFYLTDNSRIHPLLKAAVKKLEGDRSDTAVRDFLNNFGSDYMFRAIYGGKVTQQTSAESTE